MELYATPDNPVPPESIVSVVLTSDGIALRVARWSARASRGTVTIAIGRSEFIEEYYEIVRHLLARHFDVVVFDWRGQGRSDREIAAPGKGHVSSFSAYRRDLAAVESQILKMFAPRPWFALGHSMGAAILLDQAYDGTSPFERLVFTAPMIDISLRYKATKRALIRTLSILGFGTCLIPGGSQTSVFARGFETNVLTSDRRQYARLSNAAQVPGLAVGSPTFRWLAGALGLMQRFEDPRYSVATLVPILIVAAGADHIVDTAATERFAIRLKAGRCITIPEARHQLTMEREGVTKQFWAAFDAFVPGEQAPPETATPATTLKLGKIRGFFRRPRKTEVAASARSAPGHDAQTRSEEHV